MHSIRVLQISRQQQCNYLLCTFRLSSDRKPVQASPPNPETIQQDFIGPPDSVSNMRPYVRRIPKNESPLATVLRNEQIAVEKWNQDFWTRHNERFYKEKQQFIKNSNVDGNDEMTADKMSEFYKAFLEKNWKTHLNYNWEWYKKNFKLLVLALRVHMETIVSKKLM